MSSRRVIWISLGFVVGLLSISGFFSTFVLYSSADCGGHCVPVYISFKPKTVTKSEQKITTTITDKGAKTYVFNYYCVDVEITGDHGKSCTPDSVSFAPGSYSGSFKGPACSTVNSITGYEILYYENVSTNEYYSQYSSELNFNIPEC